MEKKLLRPCEHRVLAGVAAGLGEYLEIDPFWIRLIFIIMTFSGGIGILAYFVLWLLIPSDEKCDQPKDRGMNEKIESVSSEIRDLFRDKKEKSKSMLGLLIVLFGLILLISNLFHINFNDIFWPIVLIIVGVFLLLRSGKEMK